MYFCITVATKIKWDPYFSSCAGVPTLILYLDCRTSRLKSNTRGIQQDSGVAYVAVQYCSSSLYYVLDLSVRDVLNHSLLRFIFSIASKGPELD